MSSISDSKNVRDKVDKVFAQAFKLNILFRNTNSIESGEVDLSGLSFPVARAACRYMLNRYLSQPSKFNQNTELFFITGIGASHDDGSSSLRDFVQEILLTDFIPPIESIIPEQERSKVHVKPTTLASWSSQQSR